MLIRDICKLIDRARKACPVKCVVSLVTIPVDTDFLVIEWELKVAGGMYKYSASLTQEMTDDEIEYLLNNAESVMINKINEIGGGYGLH